MDWRWNSKNEMKYKGREKSKVNWVSLWMQIEGIKCRHTRQHSECQRSEHGLKFKH